MGAYIHIQYFLEIYFLFILKDHFPLFKQGELDKTITSKIYYVIYSPIVIVTLHIL